MKQIFRALSETEIPNWMFFLCDIKTFRAIWSDNPSRNFSSSVTRINQFNISDEYVWYEVSFERKLVIFTQIYDLKPYFCAAWNVFFVRSKAQFPFKAKYVIWSGISSVLRNWDTSKINLRKIGKQFMSVLAGVPSILLNKYENGH